MNIDAKRLEIVVRLAWAQLASVSDVKAMGSSADPIDDIAASARAHVRHLDKAGHEGIGRAMRSRFDAIACAASCILEDK